MSRRLAAIPGQVGYTALDFPRRLPFLPTYHPYDVT